MHRFSANYIFPVNSPPIRNGVIKLDDHKNVVEILDPNNSDEKEFASMEFHNGVIVPGFVNAHCHLELSHLKGRLESSSGGISSFVSQIRGLRKADQDQILKSINAAIRDLQLNGTVAVGDICNTSDTIDLKKNSGILFHNFVEQFGLAKDNATERFNQSKDLLGLFHKHSFSASITPHSTYSLSDRLWDLMCEDIRMNQNPVSIHYGESEQEYSILYDHTGPLAESFRDAGIPLDLPNCKTPLDVVKAYIPPELRVLFIHNTFASRDEINSILEHFIHSFFVLCPSSNLFIEKCLPDVPMIAGAGATIAIGTDSYASSNTISVFDQMMILLNEFSSLRFDEVLKWATVNGAKALGFDSTIGSIEVGKKPGLNLITDFDFGRMRPTAKSRIKRLA